MVRSKPSLAISLVALALAATAEAGPVPNVQGTLTVSISGLATMTFAGSGTVDVGSSGSLSIPASFFAPQPVTVPVTSFTGISFLRAVDVANLSGAFGIGGASSQITDEVCILPNPGEACVVGGGLGGTMGLMGTIEIHVIPSAVVLPLDLAAMRVGRGGSLASGFSVEAAPWTTRTALVNLGGTISGGPQILSAHGTNSVDHLTLVTTTYIAACGSVIPMVASLSLTAIPEPGMIGLVGVGLVGLVTAARGRRRRP